MRAKNIIVIAFVMLFFLPGIGYSEEIDSEKETAVKEVDCLALDALKNRAMGILYTEKSNSPFSQMPIDKDTGEPAINPRKIYKFDCIDVIKNQYNVKDVNDLIYKLRLINHQ